MRLLVLLLALATLVSPAAGEEIRAPAEEACAVPASLARVRPGEGGEPTRVKLGIFLIDVLGVDEVSESFEVDFRLTASWRDPRLCERTRGDSLADCRIGLAEIWHPEIDALNRRKIEVDPVEDVDIDAEGNVVFATRVVGTFSSPLDLREFPFDVQELRIRVASLEYGPNELALEVDPATTGRRPGLSLGGWDLLESSSSLPLLGAELLAHVRLDHTIVVQRQPGHYLWKGFIPMTFIVFMAWTVFWLDPKSFAPQIGLATASVFTLIAFLLSLRQFVPRVSYLTLADKLVLGMMALVFLALGEVILTSRLAQRDRSDLARRIDFHARWAYPVLFALVLLALA